MRGPGADSDSVTLSPEHIEANATYQVTRWDDYRAASPAQFSGAAFKELAITIAQTRSSVLLEYQRVDKVEAASWPYHLTKMQITSF